MDKERFAERKKNGESSYTSFAVVMGE